MTTVHGFDIGFIAERLRDQGSATLRDPEGKRLMLVDAVLVFEPTPGLWVAYEGHGAMFWAYELPINRFTLTEYGFSLKITPILADVLKALRDHRQAAIDAVQPAALAPPKGSNP